MFLSGYPAEVLPDRFRGRPVLDKPFAAERLPAALEAASREQRVRLRAHAIWEREGRPEGEDARHWAEAEAGLRAEEGRGRRRGMTPARPEGRGSARRKGAGRPPGERTTEPSRAGGR